MREYEIPIIKFLFLNGEDVIITSNPSTPPTSEEEFYDPNVDENGWI